MSAVDPDILLESQIATGDTVGRRAGTGTVERRDGYVVNESAMPMPEGNGMFVHGPGEAAAVADMPALREDFLGRGRPFGVVTIDGRTPAVERTAADLGLVAGETATAMAMPSSAFRPAGDPHLRIERVAATETDGWVDLLAAGFEMSPDIFRAILTPPLLAMLDEPWIGAVIGWEGDEPVTTASFVAHAGGVGILNVATLPAHRGKAYASAVTSDAVRRGFEAGAGFAWLEASPMGLGLYERLGFRPAWTVTCRSHEEG